MKLVGKDLKMKQSINGDAVFAEFYSSDEKVELETPFDALLFSKNIGVLVLRTLKELSKDTENKLFVQKAIKYINKKTVIHPFQVYTEMESFIKKAEFLDPLTSLGFDKRIVQRDMRIIAILHDLGRLVEIDLKTGKIITRDHALESYNILKNIGIDKAEILLPVKYHGVLNFEEKLQNDDIYKNLSDVEKKRIELYGYAIRDIDKLANLLVKSKKGVNGCSEKNNPNYKADYKLTPESVEHIKNAESCIVGEEHFLGDAILRFISWTYSVHYQSLRTRAISLVEGLWRCLNKEIMEEYTNAEIKDPEVLKQTLKIIEELKPISFSHLDLNYKNKSVFNLLNLKSRSL